MNTEIQHPGDEPAAPKVDRLRATPSRWTFLSSHGQVLLSLNRDPTKRMREVADELDLTERAVQRIVTDLEAEGYLTRVRVGRRNRYEIHAERPMRHPIVAHRDVRGLLTLLEGQHEPPKP